MKIKPTNNVLRILVVYPGQRPATEQMTEFSDRGPRLVIKSMTCRELKKGKPKGQFDLIFRSGEWNGNGVKKVLDVIKGAFPSAREVKFDNFKTRILV